MSEATKDAKSGRVKAGVIGFAIGELVGLLTAGIILWFAIPAMAPGMMIEKERSALGFDETVAAVEKGIEENGWKSPGIIDMNESLAKQGVEFKPRVKIIQLCQPEYAKSVLAREEDRYVSAIMPCAVAVWEDDSGKVWYSKMNTGLMGKLFGGNIAEVMGEKVSAEEKKILSGISGD